MVSSLPKKVKRSLLSPSIGDAAIQHLAFVIDSAPYVMLDAIDLRVHLIQVPFPLGVLALESGALRSDLSGEDWTKAVGPNSHALMADIDTASMMKVFDISQ